MSKIIVFNQEAKNKLKKGINDLANAVSVTLGPFGRNVLIEKEYGQVSSTKDGVSVAKSIELPDPIENMAASIIKQAAIKTVEQAGDGTTTSTVLARSMADKALEATIYPTTNSTQIKRGMEEAVAQVVKSLREMSTDINDENQIKQIAVLSSNGDEEIGNLVSTAMDKVGRDGIITVEEAKNGENSLEVVEGLQFERGYKSPYFTTDANTMNVILKDPLIMIYDKKISNVKDILPLLQHVSGENKSILIIAEDIEGEALSVMVMNKGRGALNICAVKAPDYGERRQNILEDIAILTGAKVISTERGMSLSKLDMNWLGSSRLVTVTKDTTTIVDGLGDKELIEKRILNIKNQLDKGGLSPFEVEKLQERLGKMVGGVAIINVGGSNEIEIKEKKDRLDDALQATKSALQEGILPGCGVALSHARNAITYNSKDNVDFNRGKKIVYEACIQPLETILNNAGESKFPYLVKLLKSKNKNLVPKIGSGDLIDSYAHGIIDPTKVVRVALQNALGAATTILLTECIIHSNKEDKKEENNFNF
jgi:chaperonin GroEL